MVRLVRKNTITGFPLTAHFYLNLKCLRASLMAQQVKNLPANEGVARDAGSTPQSGRSPEEEMATHSSILAWKIPRTEEPGRLQSLGPHRVRHD